MRYAWIFVMLALGFATVASPAQAEPVIDNQIYHWVGVGKSYWGQPLSHCPNGIQITREEVLPGPYVWANAILGGCRMSLDPQFYPRPKSIAPQYWNAEMCHIIVHEYGHLLGHEHGPGIMAAEVSANGVRGCPQFDNYMHAYFASPEAAFPVAKVKTCVRYARVRRSHRIKRRCRKYKYSWVKERLE